jgi:hypothetical protein
MLLIAAITLILSGCVSFGPETIERDRVNYTENIADSWKQVMLLNIVKIRYADSPTFLEVSSIINQYALETEVNGSLTWDGFLPGRSESIGTKGRYADRPTITYQPLTGQKFAKSLLTPIPPSALLSLMETGWRADFLFYVCVSAVNGIYNTSEARMGKRAGDPRFDELIDALTRIQGLGGMGMRIQERNKKDSVVVFFRHELPEDLAREVARVKDLLGLDPEAKEYSLAYGSMAKDDGEIAILTRSMLHITAELAARVEVPPEHVEEGRASPGVYDRKSDLDRQRSRVKIYHSAGEPDDAFVSVKYRDYWFYIDDRDFRSKRAFTFLMFLFTLAETGVPEEKPVITIPTG